MTELVRYTGDGLSESQIIERLTALLSCDGSINMAVKRLAKDGIEVERGELKELREAHAGMYQALAVELARAQEEAIVQEFREIARLGQRITKVYLDDLLEAMENDTLDFAVKRQLPQIVQALAKTQQVSVDKLLALTGRPSDGGKGDVLQAAAELVALGVLVPRDRPADIDATAEEAL